MQQPNFQQVGYLCRRVMEASLLDLQRAIPDLDVTIGQMGTLVLIACNPGITPTEICRAQGREKPTITTSLDALERKKLIVRKPSLKDRRSFSLYLTKRGREFYEAVSPLARNSDHRLTRVLSDEERENLREYLVRIYYDQCADEDEKAQADARRSNAPPPGRKKANGTAVSDRHFLQQRSAIDRTRAEVARHLKEVERYGARLRKAVRDLG